MKKTSVDVAGNISSKEFRQKYFLTQTPVILKGLTGNCEAGKKWDLEYLKRICGDVTVDVYDNKNENASSAFTTPDLKMKFADFADIAVSDEPSSLRMFLFNMFKCKPELRKDFPCPSIFKGVLGRIGFMFFGAKGVKVRIHQDIDMSNVLLTQFYGRKRVLLVSPRYSTLLYRLPFNTYSLVDLDHPDYEKYPGLKYIEVIECILNPGDTLFMPSGYWHYITYLDGGFSVSYRKMAHGLKYKTEGLLSFLLYMPFDKLMNKLYGNKWLALKEKIAQNRAEKIIMKMREEGESAVVGVGYHAQ